MPSNQSLDFTQERVTRKKRGKITMTSYRKKKKRVDAP
jgi:hypothetical protein